MVAGVTALTLGSGGSSLLMKKLLDNAGLLSTMATFKCFVNGMLAASMQKSMKDKFIASVIQP